MVELARMTTQIKSNTSSETTSYRKQKHSAKLQQPVSVYKWARPMPIHALSIRALIEQKNSRANKNLSTSQLLYNVQSISAQSTRILCHQTD